MLKKILAFALAGAMVIGSMSMTAFGAAGDLKVNSTLTVSGLDEGDTVTYYHIIDWDLDHTVNDKDTDGKPMGWAWAEGSAYNDDTTTADRIALLRQIVGSKDGAGKINSGDASLLAKNLGTAAGTDMATTNGSWSVKDQPAGLYMIIVKPATPGTVYNPIFVAANFYGNGEVPDSSNSIAISANEPSYHNAGMAKKTTIPLEKKTSGEDTDENAPYQEGLAEPNGGYTTDVGEIVSFEITTTIPVFGENYTKPIFTLKDTLTGLTIESAPVVEDSQGTTLTADTDYVYTPAADNKSYEIAFTQNYLWGKNEHKPGAAGEDIKISYTAKVTDEALKIVNEDKNTVDLIFSTEPTDTTGKGLLRDETNHFTFSIDANLIGPDAIKGSSNEGIKIGVDAEGNPIVSTKYYEWSENKEHAPLEGAEFTLLNADGSKYTNTIYPEGITVYSDADGRITIKGLDVGEYLLREVKAPNGYIKMQEDVPVKIEAEIVENVKVETEVNNAGETVEVTYKTNQLKGYTVTIGGGTTEYTIRNSNAEVVQVSRSVSSSDSELPNTKGVELPSTGGIGTTIFYAGGAILVLLAGVLLVSKRRVA